MYVLQFNPVFTLFVEEATHRAKSESHRPIPRGIPVVTLRCGQSNDPPQRPGSRNEKHTHRSDCGHSSQSTLFELTGHRMKVRRIARQSGTSTLRA